jgi:hypothetical protein
MTILMLEKAAVGTPMDFKLAANKPTANDSLTAFLL